MGWYDENRNFHFGTGPEYVAVLDPITFQDTGKRVLKRQAKRGCPPTASNRVIRYYRRLQDGYPPKDAYTFASHDYPNRVLPKNQFGESIRGWTRFDGGHPDSYYSRKPGVGSVAMAYKNRGKVLAHAIRVGDVVLFVNTLNEIRRNSSRTAMTIYTNVNAGYTVKGRYKFHEPKAFAAKVGQCNKCGVYVDDGPAKLVQYRDDEAEFNRKCCSDCHETLYIWDGDNLRHTKTDPNKVSKPDNGPCQRGSKVWQFFESFVEKGGIQLASMPNNGLSNEGIAEIISLIIKASPTDPYKTTFGASRDIVHQAIWELFAEEKKEHCQTEVQWLLKKGGNLTKRLSSFLYKRFNAKLDSDLMGKIGELARRHCPKSFDFAVDIVKGKGVHWKDGEFSDGGSCYWGCRTMTRMQFASQHNVFALRHYNYANYTDKNDKRTNGIGRCWIIVQDDTAFIFNNYGPVSLLTNARLLSSLMGGTYQSCECSNRGSRGGNLYINGDRELNSYALGLRPAAELPESHDFNMICDGHNRT